MYGERQFAPNNANGYPALYVPDDRPYDEEGNVIQDNVIAEVAYYPEKSPRETWHVLRIRGDKTRKYLKDKSISGCANSRRVVESVIHSVIYPITENHLTGMEHYSQTDIATIADPNVYYVSSMVKRSKRPLVTMQNFHNHFILGDLYRKYTQGKSLVDFACGRAGNLIRATESQVTHYIGFDIERDNIFNNKEGAYVKAGKFIKSNRQYKPTVVFGVADVSKVMVKPDRGQSRLDAGDIDDPETRDVVRYLVGKKNNKSKLHRFMSSYFKGYNPYRIWGNFDVAGCQFAVHYMFETEEKVKSLIQNMYTSLRDGGVAFLTTMDGDRVIDLLKDTPGGYTGKEASGQVDGKVVWKIATSMTKDELLDKTSPFGKKISVFVDSIGQTIDEWIVDKEVLVSLFERQGFEVVDTELFEDTLKKYDTTNKMIQVHLENKAGLKFSNLNRWYVFRKKTSMTMVKTVKGLV